MEANTTANATIQDAGTPIVDTATFQDYMLPVVQALIFVVTVYVDKFVRSNLFPKSRESLGKKV